MSDHVRYLVSPQLVQLEVQSESKMLVSRAPTTLLKRRTLDGRPPDRGGKAASTGIFAGGSGIGRGLLGRSCKNKLLVKLVRFSQKEDIQVRRHARLSDVDQPGLWRKRHPDGAMGSSK